MRHVKEETPSREGEAIELISAVKELHQHSPQELSKFLKDSENFILRQLNEKGTNLKIDVEKLARFLPLHLIAMLLSSERDEALLRYLLCGVQLLHSLCDLGSRHTRLEQILLEDIKVSEQLVDMVFYLLIVLGGYRKGHRISGPVPFLHSSLVACSLYLLPLCLSPQWQELAQVLVAHPKVDIFMDVAFRAVCINVKFLQSYLSCQSDDACVKPSTTPEQRVNYLSQQSEASLQFLLSLIQQKLFCERLLRNKELCRKGGILMLAKAILKLKVNVQFLESSTVLSSISRLKSKVIALLLHLCEAESVSYLDEVASCPGSLVLAKYVASKVLKLLKIAFSRDPRHQSACSDQTFPAGLLQLNTLRLLDILSDDSNFRSHIAIRFPEVLTTVALLPHGEFLSTWCSSDPQFKEEDASLEFDSFAAAGWILDSVSSLGLLNATYSESNFIPHNMPQASYAHQRTSLLVKVIANLHFFGPQICKEYEKNLFLQKFRESLFSDYSLPSASDMLKAASVHENLRSLLGHAESLIPAYLGEDDIQLFRAFLKQLMSSNRPDEEAQSLGGCSSPLSRKISANVNINRNLKEETSENIGLQDGKHYHVGRMTIGNDGIKQEGRKDMAFSSKVSSAVLTETIADACQNVETSGSDSSTNRGKNFIDRMDNNEFQHSNNYPIESGSGGTQENDKVETVQGEDRVPRKRKRTIMNDEQIAVIESALLDEPDMQRKPASIQSWADKLCVYGSEVTSSQLKNWLNNRKARLARAAAKDVRIVPEGDNAFLDKKPKLGMAAYDSPESPVEIVNKPTSAGAAKSHVEVVNKPSSAGAAKVTSRISMGDNFEVATTSIEPVPAIKVPPQNVIWEPGQDVMLIGPHGEEIGKGKVHQSQGVWFGRSLGRTGKCVVNVSDLNVERWERLPYPSEATGASFDETDRKIGAMCVVWDSSRLLLMQPH